MKIHSLCILRWGGDDGVRDVGLIESALANPQNISLYGDTPKIEDLAASYGFGLVNNHGFVDGNKRTAILVTIRFIGGNGYGFHADHQSQIDIMHGLASGDITQEVFSGWLKDKIIFP